MRCSKSASQKQMTSIVEEKEKRSGPARVLPPVFCLTPGHFCPPSPATEEWASLSGREDTSSCRTLETAPLMQPIRRCVVLLRRIAVAWSQLIGCCAMGRWYYRHYGVPLCILGLFPSTASRSLASRPASPDCSLHTEDGDHQDQSRLICDQVYCWNCFEMPRKRNHCVSW